MKPRSLYVHIPFCKQKCAYCDFLSFPCVQEKIERYCDALCREIETVGKAQSAPINTIFFGGGTPSILEGGLFRKIYDHIDRFFKLEIQEFTVEANPESLTEEKLQIYREIGVSRVSLGVQSLSNGVLKTIGRIHNAAQAEAAMQAVKCAGLDLNADLILGLPAQNKHAIETDIRRIAACGADHISAYELQLEAGTTLEAAVCAGETSVADDDAQAEQYLHAVAVLESLGFLRYEISNFAKKGKESLHNSGYWTGKEYIGLGLGAHGFFDGKRVRNEDELAAYLQKAEKGLPVCSVIEELTPEEMAYERVILGLRMRDGIDPDLIFQETGIDVLQRYQTQFEKLKPFLDSNARISIKPNYFNVMNQILTEF